MLTLILLSNNRPKFLRRSVLFWNKYNFKMIIVDGSDVSQRTWIEQNTKENISYFHNQSLFPKRLKIAADLTKTKYAIFVPDDEYYLPNMLNYCVNFLEKNPEYVAVNGLAIAFAYENNEVIGLTQYPEWMDRERLEEDAKDRVVAHMSNYSNNLTSSVTRVDAWKQAAYLYAKHDFHIYPLWEIEINLLLSFAGKSKTFKQLMHIKSAEKSSPPIRNNIPSLSPKNNMYNFWLKKKFYEKKIFFIDVLTKELILISHNKSYDYCKKALIDSLDAFVLKKNFYLAIFHKFLSIFSPEIKKKIKSFLNIFEIKKKQIDLIEMAKILEKKNIKINFKELNIVKESVKSHYD